MQSVPGKGSRFEILLPRVEGDTDDPAPEGSGSRLRSPQPEKAGQRVRILLVEDDASVRTVCSVPWD